MTSKEMIIGQPIKKNEDIFLRDKTGKIIGQKNMQVTFKEQSPVELANRKTLHDEQAKEKYINNRASEYPNYGEFADMMYHDIDNMVATGNIEQLSAPQRAWYEKCKAVKEKYPKPSE